MVLLIFRIATSKTGVSVAEIQRKLKIKDYKTIRVMAHKICNAMADQNTNYNLAGLVEVGSLCLIQVFLEKDVEA